MKLVQSKKIWVTAGSYIGLVLWLFFTDPQRIPIIFLMVPFLLLFTALWFTTDLLLARFLPRIKGSRKVMAKVGVSGVPVFLLILGSVNQLTWRDVVLVLCLAGFLIFYSGRIHFSES